MSHFWVTWGKLRKEFWGNRFDWPVNSSDYIFLAHAVHLLGESLFQDAWTGREPQSPWEPPLPRSDGASLTDVDIGRAQWILLMNDEGYRGRVADRALLPLPTVDEWQFAQLLSEIEHEMHWPAYSRFDAVISILCNLFESGNLPTGVRAEEGGVITHLDRPYWNGESVWVRFACCQIHAARPFDWQPVRRGGLPIFVARKAFEANLALQHPALPPPLPSPSEAASPEHLSVYLRFMVEQSQALQLTPDSEPKHSELVAMLARAWGARQPESSGRILRAMATLMRSPEAQKGRARKRHQG